MITVIEQSTAERNTETKKLFEQIQPLLDEGFSYKVALIRIGRITSNTHLRRKNGWFRDLVEYGESLGYVYGDCIYHHEDKVGQVKVAVWDHLW